MFVFNEASCVMVHKASLSMQHYVVVRKASLMMQHFVVVCKASFADAALRCGAILYRTRKAERLTHLIMYTCSSIASSDWSSHSDLTGLPGHCACALPCGEAFLSIDKLVRGPRTDLRLRHGSMPWDLTLSTLA
jgi:hypothetical protein